VISLYAYQNLGLCHCSGFCDMLGVSCTDDATVWENATCLPFVLILLWRFCYVARSPCNVAQSWKRLSATCRIEICWRGYKKHLLMLMQLIWTVLLVNVSVVFSGSNTNTSSSTTKRTSVYCWRQNIACYWWCSRSAQGRRMFVIASINLDRF